MPQAKGHDSSAKLSAVACVWRYSVVLKGMSHAVAADVKAGQADSAAATRAKLSVVAAGAVDEHQHLLVVGFVDEAEAGDGADVAADGKNIRWMRVGGNWLIAALAVRDIGRDRG